VLALIFCVVFASIADFRLPLQTSYAHWVEDEGPVTDLKKIASIPFAWIVVSVPLLSAIAHLYAATLGWEKYTYNLRNYCNPLRWLEYAVSASLMFVLIALLFAIYDLSLLIAFFTLSATVMYTGHVMESVNTGISDQPSNAYDPKNDGKNDPDVASFMPENPAGIQWEPFAVGCAISTVQWALLYSTLSTADFSAMPVYIVILLFTYFLLFMGFAVNMWYFYAYSKDFIATEVRYMILSFTSKTLLLWLIFGGVMQPSD